jgi:uroporphyrinogen decarboxylase
MTKRETILGVLSHRKPPYVPWHYNFTVEARELLERHFGSPQAMDDAVQNHFVEFRNRVAIEPTGREGFVRDGFGVIWDRTVDKDIGVVANCLLPEPTIRNYAFPDPRDPRVFRLIQPAIDAHPDRFRMFRLGFSLFERAWSMRGMEALMVDFYENPGFVRELFDAIADWDIEQVDEAFKYDIDAVLFGDDWGMQTGLLFGPALWREFIKPVLRRMYAKVRDNGKKVFIHCCGKVEELFDELIEMGVDCFNPFQPEVMDIHALLAKYRGRLSFHGGMSLQRTLPRGSVEDVRNETLDRIRLGREGGYILAPSHALEGDVPLENSLEFIRVAREQPGAP